MRFDSITNKKTNRFKDSVSKLTEKYKNDITVEETKPRLADVPKININTIAEQSRGGMTSAQIRRQANLMQQENQRIEQEQKAKEQAEWQAKTPIQKVGTVVGKTLATPVAALGELGTGVGRGFEGFADLGITAGGLGIGAMRKTRLENSQKMLDKLIAEGKISGKDAEEWQRKIEEGKKDDKAIDEATAKAIEYPVAENLLGKANREFSQNYSYLPTKVADVSKTVGTILPSLATGTELMASKPLQALASTGKVGTKIASTTSMIPFMGQAAGMSTEEALREGADLKTAAQYGALSGAVEGMIEAISGGIGGTASNKLISKLAPETISKISNKVIAKYLPRLLDTGVDLAGEGAEEWLSTYINPYIKRLTYDEKAELSTSEERMEAFVDGVLASLVLKGATSLAERTTPQGEVEALPEMDIATQNQLKSLGIQETNVPNVTQNVSNQQTNVTLPTQAEMAQKANTEQINASPNLATQKAQKTYQSAKIAGMTDVDMKKAIDLNNMLRSGANLEFYDEKNIPQNVQADKAKIANGFYRDGTLWINKNSKNKVEQILGHELTHHLETTNSYTDLSNTILDSDVFYDYISEKGYTNVAEYKTKLKEMGYTDAQMNNEMVARFVEEKLFTDQNSIDRLARQNTKLVEKIKNWISDLVVSFKGTAQEKELRRIENMYRKALDQARNTTTSAEAQYSIAGVKAMENINDAELTNAYNEAQRTGRNTRGWFKDKEGNWKFEISDKDMTLKKNLKLSDTGNRLGDILEHDALFRAYPELRDTIVNFKDIKDASGFFHKGTKEITLNKRLFNTQDWKKSVEASLIHEVQHAIQEIEGYPGAANPFWSKKAYYEELGEIEASDTKERFLKEKDGKLNRSEIKPRSSEPNPKHRMYDEYMSKRGIVDKVKDAAFPYYAGKGGKGYEISEETMVEDNKSDLRMDDSRRLRRYVNETAGKEPAFSVNPVNIAKNPPNIETGLDQLNRAKRVKEGDRQSNFASNILNQSIFDEKFTNLALDDKNIRSYESISNKETLQEANDAINEQGQKWVDRFLDKPNGEMKATDIAGGIILMNRYQQVGDYESMIRVAEKLRKAGTQQGQTIQMFSVLGRMTPEGMTYYAQKELSKAYDEILKNKTQKWADEHADEFKLNEKDIEYIQRRVTQAAKLPEGRDKYILLAEIAERIQNKIPPQPGQGLKALARNSMLLNPKTMVRNILGNVVIAPNHIVSDFIGSKIDESISKKTGIRTTGGFDVKALQGTKKGFYESFDDFRRKISTREMGGDRFEIGQGKNFYENHTGKFAETRNKINKALNGLDRVTGFLLEAGDRPFYETWFINSLNNQMKLNNVTEPTAEMIEIATDEALQRTWQDNNSYTRVVKSVRDGFNKINIKGYGLGDMVMPFVKTPANLTKAVVDFSPLGAINAAVKTSQFNKDIGKGTATAKQQREVVKAWSQVITGSLGMAILTALANAGILSGGSDEDKDVRSFEQNILGIKPYSIKIGDKTYTYDWAQPLGTSAAMVADTVKSLKNEKDTEGKVAAILEGAQSGASVLLEQSFVSGIRNLFEEDNLINALIETGFNEASKFTPQFLSQLAQIQDDTARTSYVYNNIPQTALNKVKAKIPGLRETLEPSVDVLGREVKTDNSVGNVMFNPANTAFARTTEGAEEMYRVYQATGDKATIAQVAPYYFNVGTEKVVLTPKQRTQYQKTIGKIASDGVESLLKNKAYKQLEDTDKAEILKDLYSYGTAIAKAEASTSYLLPNDMKKIKDSGMKPEEYILLKYISNLGGTKKDEKYNSLVSAGYTQKETEEFLTDYKGYKFDNTSNNTLPTLKQQRAKLPSLK